MNIRLNKYLIGSDRLHQVLVKHYHCLKRSMMAEHYVEVPMYLFLAISDDAFLTKKVT
jgi:hypothetical protein